ncbi:signal-regulatory protein beta-1-like [Polypterus senegalus]|uniref:signal-regulatory protein beta-1-like n=1 Tax=Polypterus senegalus TaxID=55291 RepID=UPI0019644F87|nr:signal-regulatory protein beta-1-like [Polypterus senegalus]
MPNLSIVLTCLICLPVGRVCQGFSVLQPQGHIEKMEGSDVTLVCHMSSETVLGPVRWYRGAGIKRTHFYSPVPKYGDTNDPRVTWTVEYNTLRYSITIRDLRVSDTGEYYCEKYAKADENKVYASGPGVTLTVKAKNVTIIGPPGRVKVGEVLELQCHANKDATFMWLKNGEAIPQDHFTTASNGALHTSRLTLQTEKGDIRSAVQCVQGKNEQQRMSEAFNLSSVITVMPRLQIQGSPDTRNRSSGKYSCRVDGFYPEDILVSWTLGKLNISACCEKAQSNNDGTFSTTCHITIALAKISSGAMLQCHAGYRDHC